MITELVPPQPFTVQVQGEEDLNPAERKALQEYRQKVSRLQKAVLGATEVVDSTAALLAQIQLAVQDAPKATPKLREETLTLQKRLREIDLALRGDNTASIRVEPTPTSITRRVSDVTFSQISSPLMPTQTRQDSYKIAAAEFAEVLTKLRVLVQTDLPKLQKALDAADVPHTPGRFPSWKD